MTPKEKQLLFIDLCARLPYGVFLKIGEYSDYMLQGIVHSNADKPLIVRCNKSDFECSIEVVRPYLRSMSSMTEEERNEYHAIDNRAYTCPEDIAHIPAADRIEWLSAHHFDYRGLIPIGIALEAKEGMYES